MEVDEVQESAVVSGGLAEYEPKGPRPIKKLSTDVINSIAAAEVSGSLLVLHVALLAFVSLRSAKRFVGR